jgi:hypothetical protein
MDEQEATLRAKLTEESGRLGWTELQRHFARGSVIKVAADLDLLEVALAVAMDRREVVENWIAAGRISHAADIDAIAWHARNAHFQAVVAAPWVLVREEVQ